MSSDVETLFSAITGERGGVDQISPVQLALARALAQALAAEPINPSVVSQLTALLPPPVKPSAGHIDLSKLSDEDLDLLEAMYARAAVPGPAPASDSAEARVNELLNMNAQLQGIIDETQRAEDAARRGEEMWARLHQNAMAECDELRKRLEAAEAAAWRAAHPEPQQAAPGQPEAKPSNVVPLAR